MSKVDSCPYGGCPRCEFDDAVARGENPPTYKEVSDEAVALAADAKRYRFIRDNLAQVSSVHMNGDKHYHLRSVRGMHKSFDLAIDHMMENP